MLNDKQGPIVLTILDGWGLSADSSSNAVSEAVTPHMDELLQKYPHTRLACSGMAVGLPEGQMGNSEVGHTNIGAGRVVYQDFTRITKAIASGDFFANEVLQKLITDTRTCGGTLHIMGLLSDGGVHSHNGHLYALLEMARQKGLSRVAIHAFLDGRDVPPQSALKYIQELEQKSAEIGIGRIATVSGRYYAMDRDKRWNRVEKAYEAVVDGHGRQAADALTAVQQAYAAGETDEFVMPFVVGEPQAMQPGDGVIYFNFRPDRARELTHALVDADFAGFVRRRGRLAVRLVTFTEYDAALPVPAAFPPEELHDTLGEVVSKAGYTQLRIAETEKYAHVTFFFNGGEEQPFAGEKRILVPSPQVATYDLQPEMSAVEVTDRLLQCLIAEAPDFVVLNFANGDMVGHTGNLPAAIKAVETVDACVGRAAAAIRAQGGTMLITADHGNCEQMVDQVNGGPFTAHTTNEVPFILVSDAYRRNRLNTGRLADIAPTVLDIAGIKQPCAMTGKSLIIR